MVVHQGKDLVEHGKLALCCKSGVFVGLGLMHCRKSWLVYSGRTNRVYSSTNCMFDETLFPAKKVDQRVYGYRDYDNQPINQFSTDMHEVKLNSTLVSDFPNLSMTATPLWTADDVCVEPDAMQSALSRDMLGLPHIESLPINIAPAGNASEPGGGSVIDNDVSDPGGGSPEAGNSSAGDEQPFPKSCKHKGKRQRSGDKVPPLGEAPTHWKDCQSKTIASATDSELAEYLIGYALEHTLLSDVRSVSSLLMKNTMWQQIKIDTTGNTNFVALMGALQVISMQRAYAFRSTVQAPEQKNQTEARSRSDAQDWIDSEWVEMDTIYRMGTIVYIKN
eukprot:2270908-Rhodomonas_salina.1